DRRHPADDGLLGMLYAVAAAVAVAAMLVTRRVSPRPVAAGAFTGFVIVLSAVFGIFGRPPQVVATSDICLLNGLAVLIPWGFGAQLSVALATLAGLGFVLPERSLSTPVVDPILTVTAGGGPAPLCAVLLGLPRPVPAAVVRPPDALHGGEASRGGGSGDRRRPRPRRRDAPRTPRPGGPPGTRERPRGRGPPLRLERDVRLGRGAGGLPP